MSAVGEIETAAEALKKDITGGQITPVVTDLKVFETAFSATKKFAQDLKSGAAKPEEGLGVIDDLLKSLAVFFPPAASFEPYVEVAEVVVQVADDLGIIKTQRGPLKDVFDGKTPPERVFGFEK